MGKNTHKSKPGGESRKKKNPRHVRASRKPAWSHNTSVVIIIIIGIVVVGA